MNAIDDEETPMEPPSHPDTDDIAADRRPQSRASWATVAFIAIVAILLVTVVILHLTGVIGPAAH